MCALFLSLVNFIGLQQVQFRDFSLNVLDVIRRYLVVSLADVVSEIRWCVKFLVAFICSESRVEKDLPICPI